MPAQGNASPDSAASSARDVLPAAGIGSARLHEPVVETGLVLHQLVMRATLRRDALVKHDNLVAVADRAQPVRDDQARDPPTPECVVDQLLVPGIEGAGRFVENQYCRIAGQCSGNSQPLPLPAAEIASILIDLRPVAERPAQDFVVDAGIPGLSLSHC